MSLILRPSRIHSYGCYTTRRIRKGTLVVEYVGEPMTNEQADDLYDNFPNTYLFYRDPTGHVSHVAGEQTFQSW